MFIWIIENWMYLLLAFFILEKVVKLTPIEQDDIVIDFIGKNVWKGLKYLYAKSVAGVRFLIKKYKDSKKEEK